MCRAALMHQLPWPCLAGLAAGGMLCNRPWSRATAASQCLADPGAADTTAASTSTACTTWCSLSSHLRQAANVASVQGCGQKHMTAACMCGPRVPLSCVCKQSSCRVPHRLTGKLSAVLLQLLLLLANVVRLQLPVRAEAACVCAWLPMLALCLLPTSLVGLLVTACEVATLVCMPEHLSASLLPQALLLEYVLSWMHSLLVDCWQPSCCIKLRCLSRVRLAA